MIARGVPDRAEVLRGVDLGRLLVELTGCGPRAGQYTCPCPDHAQTGATPPVSVSVAAEEYGLWRCHGCGAGGTAVDVLMVARGLTVAQALGELAGTPSPSSTAGRRRAGGASSSTRAAARLPDERQVNGWAEQLQRRADLLDRISSRKGWTPGACAALGVGWDGERFTFPVRDAAGELVNLVRYLPGSSPKSLALAGRPRDLFPAPELLAGERVRTAGGSTVPLADRIDLVLVEGEADAVAAVALGMIAFAVPGCNGWRPEWAARFAGWRVRVLLDHDEPGRRLAERLAADLAPHAEVRVVTWPQILGHEPPDGFDMADFATSVDASGPVAA